MKKIYLLILLLNILYILSYFLPSSEVIFSMCGTYDAIPRITEIINSIVSLIVSPAPFLFAAIVVIELIKKILSIIPFRFLQKLSGFWQKIANSIKPNVRLNKISTLLLIIFLIINLINLLYISSNYSKKIIHVGDEFGYLLTAKALSQGRFSLTPPEYIEHFEKQLIIDDHWVSQYTPGHPALLVPGIWLNQLWVIPPVLATLSALFIFLTALFLFNSFVAWLSFLLLVTSPFYQMNSINYMSHNSAFFAGSATLFLASIYLKKRKTFLLPLISFSAGLMVFIRPYTGLFFCLPIGLIILPTILKKSNAGSRSSELFNKIGLIILGALPSFLFFVFYNYAILGSFFSSTLQYGMYFLTGINQERPLAWALLDFQASLSLLQKVLFALPFWAVFSGLYLFILLFKGCKEKWLILIPIIMQISSHIFYKGSWMMYGPRFWYEIIGLLAIASAVGFSELIKIFQPHSNNKEGQQPVILSRIFISLVIFMLAINPIRQWYSTTSASRWHRDYTPENIAELEGFNWANDLLVSNIRQQDINNSIIFINQGVHWWNYMVPASQMLAFSNETNIYVKNIDQFHNQRIIDLYPEKNIFYADYDTGQISSSLID